MWSCIRPSAMNQLRNGKVPHYISSSITVIPLPALSGVTCSSFTEYSPSFIERELYGSPINSFSTSFAASDALLSTCMPDSKFTSDLCINNELSDEKLSSGSYIIGSSSCDTSLASVHSSYKDNPSYFRMVYPRVTEQISLSHEPFPRVFDFPTGVDISDQQNVAIVSPKIQDSITIDHTHLAKQKELLSCGSTGQFVDTSGFAESVLKAVDEGSTIPFKYSYCHTRNSVSNPFSFDELCNGNLHSSSMAPTKSRMRWTPELHEQFVGAINKLGGSEKATPKAVQKVMKVEGLTIYHVKSHLQKYRAVCHQSETSDGMLTKGSQMDVVSSQQFKGMGTSEGLKAQISLQKQLHDQLEIQRKLQLRVEEQSRYLEMIIAKQSESLKQLGALARFQCSSTQVCDGNKAREE